MKIVANKMGRQFIVRPENISFPARGSGPYVVEAISGSELLENVFDRFNIQPAKLGQGHLELWSNPLGTVNRIRLDTLESIPPKIMDVWIRYANGRTNPHPNHPLSQSVRSGAS